MVRSSWLLTLLSLSLISAAPAGLHPVLMQLPGEDTPELIGAWQGGRWLNVADTVTQVTGMETYQRRALTGAATTVRGAKPRSAGEPCEFSYLVPAQPTVKAGAFLVFTSAKLNVRPRPVTVLPTSNATYREVVRQELVKRGLKNPQVKLVGVTRADLDGNGTDEVIIEAQRFTERDGLYPPPVGQPGDYSLLLLRFIKDGQVVTSVLGEHIAPLKPWTGEGDAPMPMANTFRLAGIADLNGDGRMELITYGAYYEGNGFTVSEWSAAQGERSTPLEGGCGV